MWAPIAGLVLGFVATLVVLELVMAHNVWWVPSGHRLADAYRMSGLLICILMWRFLCRHAYDICIENGADRLRKLVLCSDYQTLLYVALLYEIGTDAAMCIKFEYVDAEMLSPAFITKQAVLVSTSKNQHWPQNWFPGWQTVVNATLRDQILAEVSITQHPFMLRWFPLATPVFVCVTFIICALATGRHVRALWKWHDSWHTSYKRHDFVMQINALPLVYGIMSLKSVMRTWEVIMNTFSAEVKGSFDNWLKRKDIMLGLSSANFNFANVFEAWALAAFARLVLTVISDSLNDLVDRNGSISVKISKLLESMTSMAVLGIDCFLWSCFLTSVYSLSFIGMKITYPQLVNIITPDLELKIRYLLLGIGTVASTVAIANIVTLERKFHSELEDFKPLLKFLSTKILVSLAFLQDVVNLILGQYGFSEVQTNLIYSSLLCFECMLVSLLHHYAWACNEDWYGDGYVNQLCAKPLLAGVEPA